MADFSKVGRGNKNRGRKFERDVAALLGWSRVPYSGAIKEWGGADVVDGFYKKGGYWAAECKTVVLKEGKPANIDVKHKWIEQLIGGEMGGRHGILVVRRIRDPKKHVGKKALPAYVIFPEDTWDWFLRQFHEAKRRSIDWAWDHILVNAYCTAITAAKGYNFRISATALEDLDISMPYFALEYIVDRPFGKDRWYVMRLDQFATIVKTHNIMVHDDETVQRVD